MSNTPIRVLLVEDSETDAALALRELQRGGFLVDHRRVDSAPAFLAAIEGQAWDMILSDFSMPDFNGLRAFELLMQTGLDIPFIFVSGRIGEERAAEAMRRGAKDYILKDNLNRLVPAVRRELNEAEERRRRQAMADALRESEEQYQELVEKSIQGIMIVQDGKIVRANPSCAAMFGYQIAAELIGTVALEVVHPDDRHEALQTGSAEMRSGHPQLFPYYRGVKKDGSLMWYEARQAPTKWQGRRAIQWTLQDVTERKLAEERLRANERLLQTVFDTIPYALLVKDDQSRYLKVNRAWCERYGLVPEDVLGKSTLEIPGRSDAARKRAFDEDQSVFAGKESAVFEGIGTIRNGESRYFHTIKSPLKDAAGRIVGLVGATVDLTEQKRAEEALRENNLELESANRQLQALQLSLEAEVAERTLAEQRFRQLVELAPNAMVTVNAHGRIVLVNAQVLAWFGYGRDELIGQPVEMLIPERYRAGHPALVSGFFRAPAPRTIGTGRELHGRRKDGSEFPVDISLSPIETAEGLQAIASVMDLTSIRLAEAEVRASQRLLQTVFDTIPVTLAVKDAESRYRMVNKAWREQYGVAPEKAVGIHTLDIPYRPEQEKLASLEQDRKALAAYGSSVMSERWDTSADGQRRYLHGIKAAIRDEQGRATGLVAATIDFTEQKRAEQALQERERQLSTIYDTVGDTIYQLAVEKDGRYRFVSVNQAFRSTTGLSNDQVVGKRVDEVVAEPSLAMVLGKYEEAIRDKKIVRWEETSDYPKGRLTGDVSVAAVFDNTGTCTHLVGAVHDMTETKRQEEMLRQSQKLEAIGSLAGGISHDFNNLLTVISSHAEFIVEEAGGAGQIRDDAQMILDAGARAAALTRQLLAFSRKQVLQMRVLDLNATVANLEKMLQRLIGEHIELRSTLAPMARKIYADPTQIEQIVMNLVVNARDAMPNGGKLLIETANRALDETYASTHTDVKPGDYVMVSVTDTGEGMDQKTVARIFEPFFTTKPQGKGTGMGLATVYGIVKQMNGSIFVYSEPGKGTAFKIYFPVSAEESTTAAAAKSSAKRTRAKETVLLVEDEEMVRKSALRILESEGYTVLQASDAEAALTLFGAHSAPIDLLLSDVVMPGLSGRELWDKIRATRPVPVLFMSGYTDDAIVRHGILEGNLPFINKPFTKQSLLNKVREVLDQTVPSKNTTN